MEMDDNNTVRVARHIPTFRLSGREVLCGSRIAADIQNNYTVTFIFERTSILSLTYSPIEYQAIQGVHSAPPSAHEVQKMRELTLK